MQEKRSKRLLISLVVLVLLTLMAFWKNRNTQHTVVDPDLFRKYDSKTIDRIELRSPKDTVVLHFNGSKWMVNEVHVAEASKVEVLFATLLQAEPKRPVADRQVDSIAQALKTEGVQVRLLSQNQEVEEFHAGGNGQKTQAYFLHSDGLAYVMAIPGYRVYVSGIFELPEKDWRDKYVFGFNWRNFQSLEAIYPSKPEDGFLLELNNSVVEMKGNQSTDTTLLNNSVVEMKGNPLTDTTLLNNYLDDVSLLTVNEFSEEGVEQATLRNQVPTLELVVRDIGRKEYRLQLYPWPDGNWMGLIGGSEWGYFSASKIKKLHHAKSYFTRKSGN